ncbi:glycosyltransferase family 2 protein [Ligilactobacillus sp. LYQ139]|uniref:glycosyltransferase family 2 protein n=1 Tax=Ligilactobacillus sp. LYQ139 TaxID=3378800 RepID=UPI00385539BB
MNIAVIIPVYNAAANIQRCVDGILAEKCMQQGDIYLVDDGSTDQSAETMKKLYGQLANVHLFQQDSQGQAIARQKGLVQAISDGASHVIFIDSDDQIERGMLDRLATVIGDQLLAVCGIKKIFPSHAECEITSTLQQATTQLDLVTRFLCRNQEMDAGLWNKLFRTDIIAQNGIKFQGKNFYEDSFFVLQYLTHCTPQQIKWVKQPLYDLYKHEGSTTYTYDQHLGEKFEWYVTAVQELMRQVGITLPSDVWTAFYFRIALHFIHHQLRLSNQWMSRDTKKKLRKLPLKLGVLKQLPRKYAASFILIKTFSGVYHKLYRIKRSND